MGEVKIRDTDEIDTVLDCPCGSSFYIYLVDTPYECPDCHRLYEVNVSVKEITGNTDRWRMLGTKI